MSQPQRRKDCKPAVSGALGAPVSYELAGCSELLDPIVICVSHIDVAREHRNTPGLEELTVPVTIVAPVSDQQTAGRELLDPVVIGISNIDIA